MKYLGIDLGWQSGPSGVCCLTWQEQAQASHSNAPEPPAGKSGALSPPALKILDLQRLDSLETILDWVDRWSQEEDIVVIAVDAPTLIPNETGMRLPDRLAHRYFGKYDAGCYPANLNRPFAQRLIDFGLALEERGFQHFPHSAAQAKGKFQLEVFPHPAMVHLFQLDRILKYKKGRLAQRRAELERLRTYQLEVLPTLNPSLCLQPSDLPPIPDRGAEVKAVEDQLDSIICAYVAAHWWYWGTDRNWILGDRTTGYIVVPAPLNPNDSLNAIANPGGGTP